MALMIYNVNVTFGEEPKPDCTLGGLLDRDKDKESAIKDSIKYTYTDSANAEYDAWSSGINQTYTITANPKTDLDNYTVVAGKTGTLTINARHVDVTITGTATVVYGTNNANFDKVKCVGNDSTHDLGDIKYELVGYTTTTNAGKYQNAVKIKSYSNQNFVIDNIDTALGELEVLKSSNVTINHADKLEANWIATGVVLQDVIQGSSTNTQDSSVTYNITFAPEAGTGVTKVTYDGIYNVTIVSKETSNYNSVTKDVVVKIESIQIGSEYYTVEDALKQTENTTSAQTITLQGNAFISNNVTVGKNVTLVLPSDEDSSSSINEGTYGKDTDDQNKYVDDIDSEIKCKLTIVNGIYVTVNGSILVRGLLGANGGSFEGHTCGNHSQIINNGTMKFNTGSQLGMRGYMKGTGKVFFYKGSTVYSPFVVRDYGGGTHSKGAYKKGPVAPFLQYEMPNIQCESFTYGGAKHVAYCALLVPTFSMLVKDIVNIYSSDGVLRIKDDETSYVRKTYSNNKTTLQFVGEITMGSLTIQQYGQEVKMSTVFFPISYLHNIIIGDGSTQTILNAAYDYKLMPGTSLTIEPNATVNLTGRAIVYNTINYSSSASRKYPIEKGPAKLIVNGTLKISGGFGGIIRSTANTGCIMVVTTNTSNLTVTSIEGEGTGSAFSQNFSRTATVEEVARAMNSDESTTTNLSAGTTYNYNGSKWTIAP